MQKFTSGYPYCITRTVTQASPEGSKPHWAGLSKLTSMCERQIEQIYVQVTFSRYFRSSWTKFVCVKSNATWLPIVIDNACLIDRRFVSPQHNTEVSRQPWWSPPSFFGRWCGLALLQKCDWNVANWVLKPNFHVQTLTYHYFKIGGLTNEPWQPARIWNIIRKHHFSTWRECIAISCCYIQ